MSRNAQLAVIVSSVVVAVCAVVLTVAALTGGLVVHRPMTFDSAELAKRVHKVLLERHDLGGTSGSMSCPQNVAIEDGTAFGCSFEHNGKLKTVRVVVSDTESSALEVERPSD